MTVDWQPGPMVPVIVGLVLVTAGPCHAADCLPAAPATVTLDGVLERIVIPGPPDYQSLSGGDAPETYIQLRLEDPVCVDDQPEVQSSRLQLDLPWDAALRDSPLSPLLGTDVTCEGALSHWQTDHHHTPILLAGAYCSAPGGYPGQGRRYEGPKGIRR